MLLYGVHHAIRINISGVSV